LRRLLGCAGVWDALAFWPNLGCLDVSEALNCPDHLALASVGIRARLQVAPQLSQKLPWL